MEKSIRKCLGVFEIQITEADAYQINQTEKNSPMNHTDKPYKAT